MATELVRGLINIRHSHQGSAITIGNFDGIHLGHQALLVDLQKTAALLQTQCGVVLFEPQPLEFFQKKKNLHARLTPWREKFNFLSQKNLDFVLIIPFNAALAALEAKNFIQEILVDRLKIRHILIGDDFHFGKARAGDFALLQSFGASHGFTAKAMQSITLNGRRISSSIIRQALNKGNLGLAGELLGHPYIIRGRVVGGEKLGRKLGCPTANIRIHQNCSLHGIYTVKVHGVSAKPLPGVASVGRRPSVGGSNQLILEVHILDFSEDIYNKHVCIEFLNKLRNEEMYASLDLLKEQIVKDVQATRKFFKLIT